jgi:CBS domain-containing protein
MRNVLVRHLMSSPPLCIAPDAALADADLVMTTEKVRRLPVVDAEGRLLGIISRGDVREGLSISAASHPYAPDAHEHWLTVADVMAIDVVTVSSDAPLWLAADLMLQHKIGGLPVMKGREIVGIVTESDIFKLLVEQLRTEADPLPGY